MIEIKELTDLIEKTAPQELSEDWDNSGWQIKLENPACKKICLALSPTLDVIEQAVENGCDFLITHHPLFFEKTNKLLFDNLVSKIAQIAIKNNLQIYCAHTNLDKASNGLNYAMAKKLGLDEIEKVNDFVFQGKTSWEYNLNELINLVKKTFEIDKIKLINPLNKNKVNSIAICTGSGMEFAQETNADVFLSGDLKYHTALNIQDKIVMDIGHFESEKFVVDLFKEIFKNKNIEIFVAKEKNPWTIV